MKHLLISVLGFFLVGSCTSTAHNTLTPTVEVLPQSTSESSQILFDDFSYSSIDEMSSNGWVARNGSGWPGVTGATFRVENVSFIDYPNPEHNRLLRMTASTDGTGENTYQTQICHQRKYLEGTYAARVFFNNEPEAGLDGDQVVETFYMI